jgi:hypothetical protein
MGHNRGGTSGAYNRSLYGLVADGRVEGVKSAPELAGQGKRQISDYERVWHGTGMKIAT